MMGAAIGTGQTTLELGSVEAALEEVLHTDSEAAERARNVPEDKCETVTFDPRLGIHWVTVQRVSPIPATEGLGFEPRSPFGRRFSRPVQ